MDKDAADLKCALEDLKCELEDLKDEIQDLRDDVQDEIESAISDAISEYFSEGIEDFLASHQFVLKNGTVVQTRLRTRVMAPDKKKVLICYGGAKVVGSALHIQTRVSSWEDLYTYPTESEAIAALQKLNNGMEQGVSLVEL